MDARRRKSDKQRGLCKAEGATSAPAPAASAPAAPASSPASSKSKAKPPAPTIVRTPIPEGPGAFAVFIERAGKVVRAVPVLGTQLASIPGLLDQSAKGGRGTSTFLLLLGLVAVGGARGRGGPARLHDRGSAIASPSAPVPSRACDR